MFIEEPKAATLADYQICIDQMVETVKKIDGVLAIYQIGGLSAPGISDIDIVVIFEDGIKYVGDPRQNQSPMSRYLFAHPLFGTSLSLFHESQKYTFFHNYRVLYGQDVHKQSPANRALDNEQMKKQLANEFLVRMLVNMSVEREYKIFKLRHLLLHGNALVYDLEFLNQHPKHLMDCLEKILDWRKIWFTDRPSNTDIKGLYDELWTALNAFLNAHLNVSPLYLPKQAQYKLARNIELRDSAVVTAKSRGLKLPCINAKFARKLIAISHRLNTFVINVPIQTDNIPAHISQSFDYGRQAHKYNQQHLPHFMPLTSSLVIS